MVREGDEETVGGETAQRILIVDDAPLNRAILREMLGDTFQLAEAADGAECMAQLEKYGTDIALVLLAPCCLLAARLQPGKDNLVGLDPNLALLAAGFLIYALFNAVFLPSFYKNGYKVGVAFVKATIPMALLMLVMEALPHIPGLTWLDDMDAATQLRLLPVLIGGILIYTGCTLLTFRAAAGAYEKVDM